MQIKLVSKTLLLFVILNLITGCNKQSTGAVTGAVVGGLVGSRFSGENQWLATGIGAALGATLGGELGRRLDEHDKVLIVKSSQQALEFNQSGQSIEWRNPDSGHHGYVTPTKTYKNYKGDYCREYIQEVIIGGEKQKLYGRACRKPDGQWEAQQQEH